MVEFISVIIPTYNRYEQLRKAILSVYAQTYRHFELIVVDDGSTDVTRKITDEFKDIHYIYKKNGGVSSARNLGTKHAQYGWIAFLDSDDEWHKEKLSKHINFHKNNPNISISYSDEKWIRNGVEVSVGKKFQKYSGEIFEKCLSHCIIAPSATFIQKDFLQNIGSFDESLEVCEDYDLYLRITQHYGVGLINEKLITKYGGADDQLSVKFWGMDRFRVKALEKLNLKDKNQQKMVHEMLLKKYKLLLKGALKHKREEESKIYEQKIELLYSEMKEN